MSEQTKLPSYFLAANSPGGFISFFKSLSDTKDFGHCYIIKGGPGSGKSTLMKTVAKAAQKKGYVPELIYCSSDPDSLDGIYIPQLNVSIFDGTAPHVMEADYPGVCDSIVNVGDCWDSKKLSENRTEILSMYDQISEQHKRAKRYLNACGSLINDISSIVTKNTDYDKLSKFAGRLIKKEFPKADSKKAGTDSIRFLTGITPKGLVFMEDTAKLLCDKFYIINDEYSSISNNLLVEIRQAALKKGYNTVSCYCCIKPAEKLEHLLIPELKLGFITSNSWHTSTISNAQTINSSRFVNSSELSARKNRLSFNKKIANELMHEATQHIHEAKRLHDILEGYYIDAMNFKKVTTMANNLAKEILL